LIDLGLRLIYIFFIFYYFNIILVVEHLVTLGAKRESTINFNAFVKKIILNKTNDIVKKN